MQNAHLGMTDRTRDNPVTYDGPARALHWVTAGMLVLLFGLGLSMTRWFEEDEELKLRVYSWHEWTGLTLFLLTAFRLWWRGRHPAPPLDLPAFERAASRLTYGAFYMILFVQPVSGWLMNSAFGFTMVYLGLVPLPNLVPVNRPLALFFQWVHFTLAMLLVALTAAHVGAVLYHHVLQRDGVLHRMLPSLRARP
ncbi:MAG: cytochrome b [Acidobacteria bacterium]|nr:MAG: cytochrome b [Acidobacteriota bacterium]